MVLASLALMQNRSGRITSWYVLINYIVTIPDQGPSIWQTQKTLRPFKDKGWPLYNWMCEIIPSGIASGHHSFDASAAPSTTPAESAPPTPAAPGIKEDLIMKGPTASSTIPVDASTTLMSQSPSLSSFLQSGLADENSNSITTSTSYMRPPLPICQAKANVALQKSLMATLSSHLTSRSYHMPKLSRLL